MTLISTGSLGLAGCSDDSPPTASADMTALSTLHTVLASMSSVEVEGLDVGSDGGFNGESDDVSDETVESRFESVLVAVVFPPPSLPGISSVSSVGDRCEF